MSKYRKKPIVIEATQFTHVGPPAALPAGVFFRVNDGVPFFYVVTVHGQETQVVPGDYIITEQDGIHHYPCKPEIFIAFYDLVE